MSALCRLDKYSYLCTNTTVSLKNMILYHGSSQLVTVPLFGAGRAHNDFGPGFYCTQDLDLAKEWACPDTRDGFANQYRLNEEGLTCLNLNEKPYNILNWLAILLENREFSKPYSIVVGGKQFILDHFLPDYKGYDLIIGYRADDSYFSFARDFLSNSLTLEQLSRAMYLGRLGTQIVLKSERAFDAIWKEMSHIAPGTEYHAKRVARDVKAREDYLNIQREIPPQNGIFLIDIMRQNWQNDDPRIP